MISHITKRVVETLGLKVTRTDVVQVNVFGGKGSTPSRREFVLVNLKTRNGDVMVVECMVSPTICHAIEGQNVDQSVIFEAEHLYDLPLADDLCKSGGCEIDLLLGLDVYFDILTGDIRKGSSGPVAIGTRFGYVLAGPSYKIYI